MTEKLISKSTSDSITVRPVNLQHISEMAEGNGPKLFDGNLSLVQNVKVKLEVIVGQVELTIKELFDLRDQSTVKLDAKTNTLVDIRLDGKTIARGQLVVAEDNLGVQIEEIIS